MITEGKIYFSDFLIWILNFLIKMKFLQGANDTYVFRKFSEMLAFMKFSSRFKKFQISQIKLFPSLKALTVVSMVLEISKIW